VLVRRVCPTAPSRCSAWIGAPSPACKPHAQPSRNYTPIQLGGLYAFPPADDDGQTVAVIELGGGYRTSDLQTYFTSLG